MAIRATRRAIFVGAPASLLALSDRGFVSSGLADSSIDKALMGHAPISVKEYGARGDGSTNDYAAITLARNVATSEGRALLFPEGNYVHNATLEFAFDSLHVIFEGRVTLIHRGIGRAISFDSGPTPLQDGKTGVCFGWGNAPTVIGNGNTTELIYVRGCHHMKLDARLRDCEIGFRCEFSVLSHFRIAMSGNQGGWTIKNPKRGIIVDRRGVAEATTCCRFDIIIEGIHGLGVELKTAQHCDFWGTSEGNSSGGVKMDADSINNNFHNFFCEQNGTAPHWIISGHNNIFLNCTSGGPTNTGTNTTVITGVRNLFLRGKFYNLKDTGYYNEWRQVALSGTLSMNSNNIREKCHDGAMGELAELYPAPEIVQPKLSGLWRAQGELGQRTPGYFKDRSGLVHLVGAVKSGTGKIFDLPTGYRPGGTLFLPYDNVTANSVGRLSVSTRGEVKHMTGGTETVTLDTVSFFAEN